MNGTLKDMIGKKTLMVMLLLAMVAAHGCYYENAGLEPIDCTNVQPKFSTDVLPLIQSRCATANCHDASASGGIILQNYTQVFTVKDRIKTRAVVQKTMPVFTPLNAAETATLKCWIDNGAINN